MEHGAPNPRIHLHKRGEHEPFPEAVGRAHAPPHILQPFIVDRKVAQREDDTRGFLHERPAVERPLAVELVVALRSRVGRVGQRVPALVPALRRAIPRHELG